jgi:hypothetical protein
MDNATLYSQRIYTSTSTEVPQKPQLQNPPDLAAVLPQNTTFAAFYSGTSVAGVVQIKLSRTQDFASDVDDQSIGDGSSNSFTATHVFDFSNMSTFGYGHYYWMAVSVNNNQYGSEPSDVRQFDIVYNYPPLLQMPENNYSTKNTSVIFGVRYYANAITPSLSGTIRIQIATDPDFTHLALNETIAGLVAQGTTVGKTVDHLAAHTYYWRAQCVDQAGVCSVYSDTRQFTVLGENTPTVTPTLTMTPTITPTALPDRQTIVVDHYIYITDPNGGLQIYDNSDPSHPRLVYSLQGNWRIYIKDHYLYMVDCHGTLYVDDIHDPSQPREITKVSTGGEAVGIDGIGNYIFVADGKNGVSVFDISMPNDVCQKPRVSTADNARDVRIVAVEKRAYVVWPDGNKGWFDISEYLSSPTLDEGGYATPNPFLPLRGQKAYFNFTLKDAMTAYHIRIYNLRGQLQRTLTNTREWDGRSEGGHVCEGGVYVYQIEAEGKRVTGNVVLIK